MFGLGQMYLYKADQSKALECFERVRRARPDSADATLAVAGVYAMSTDPTRRDTARQVIRAFLLFIFVINFLILCFRILFSILFSNECFHLTNMNINQLLTRYADARPNDVIAWLRLAALCEEAQVRDD